MKYNTKIYKHVRKVSSYSSNSKRRNVYKYIIINNEVKQVVIVVKVEHVHLMDISILS